MYIVRHMFNILIGTTGNNCTQEWL